MPSTRARYHYHATMEECGHRVGFDVDVDLLTATIKEGGQDFQVKMPCRQCPNHEERTTAEGSVMPGGEFVQFCVTCKKGFDG